MTLRRLFACMGLRAWPSSLAAPGHAYTYSVDEFSVTRNGALIFDDPFSDGGPPPSAPNFVGGIPATYGMLGSLGPEAAGKLTLQSSSGAVNDPHQRDQCPRGPGSHPP